MKFFFFFYYLFLFLSNLFCNNFIIRVFILTGVKCFFNNQLLKKLINEVSVIKRIYLLNKYHSLADCYFGLQKCFPLEELPFEIEERRV